LGLCLPFLISSTYLQLFLRTLKANNLVVGLIPVFLEIGIVIFSFFSAYYTTDLKHKRKAVIIVHLIVSIPLLIFGITYYLFHNSPFILTFFLICYFFFSGSIGLTIPVWQNFILKIFSEKNMLKGISIMYIVQHITRLITGFITAFIVAEFSFSYLSTSLIFIYMSIVIFFSSFFFLMAHEKPGNMELKKSNNISEAFKSIFSDKNFIYFLGNELSFYALIGIISFYANYAKEFCYISSETASGYFVIFSYAGSILAYIIFGTLNLFSYKAKLFVSKSLALTTALVIIFFDGKNAFFLASFLSGASISTRFLIYPVMVKKLSGKEDATSYLSCFLFLMLPLSVGIPLANGWLLDILKSYGKFSYQIVFSIMAALILTSYYFLLRLNMQESASGKNSRQKI